MKLKSCLKKMIPVLCMAFMVSCTGTEAVELPPADVDPVAVSADEEPSGETQPEANAEEDAVDIGEVGAGAIGDEISGVLEEVTADEPAGDGEEMEITWGYTHIPGQDISNVKLADDSEVIKALNEQFGVVLKGQEITFDRNMYYGDWEALDVLPDVFVVSGDADYAYGTGSFRTIPHDMVESYAPNLTALLNANPDGWVANNPESATGEFLGLGYYGEYAPQLQMYSAYRLDWLEQSGFELPADMVAVGANQYFSPTPFTMDRFYEAMRAIMAASSSTPEHYGFAYPMSNDTQYILDTAVPNLANMFGLNATNMNENGKANMYYATDAYADFLTFMADMYAEGYAAVKGTMEIEYSLTSISSNGGDDGLNQNYEVGYWNEFTSMLVDDGAWYSTGRQLVEQIPGARILYVPPETHIPFEPALSQTESVGAFGANRTDLLMVNKSVSDEKLAAILKIYDTCAFDPETRVLSTYGYEGVNFDWAGEPFNSFVQEKPTEESPSYNNSYNLLNPQINGGPAYNPLYEQNINPDNPIYLHSLTPEAAAMTVPAYKETFSGEFNTELEQWRQEHYADIRKVYTDYFYEIVLGEADVDSTWDGYIDSLNAAGLAEYLEILEKLPTIE